MLNRDEAPEDAEIRNYGSAIQATGATGAADFGHADHKILIQGMIDSVREQREVIIPVNSGRLTLEMVLAMYKSAARGKAVDLPIADDEGVWTWPE